MEQILVVAVLSLWLLFPIGMFISIDKVDKDTDQKMHLK